MADGSNGMEPKRRSLSFVARISNLMAGVDSETLAKCPRVDQLSISILGAWMLITFLFIAGLNFYALHFVIGKTSHAAYAAIGISLSILFADRIILAWSWFASERLRISKNKIRDLFVYSSAVVVRVLFSVALSLFVGIFFMLAFFDDKISEQMKVFHRSENASFYDQVDRFVKDYDAQTALLRNSLKATTDSHSKYLGNAADVASDIAIPDALKGDLASKTSERDRLRSELPVIEAEIKRQIDIQTGEIEGAKHAGSGERKVEAGFGPNYRAAKRRELSARRELAEKQTLLNAAETGVLSAQKAILNFQNAELDRRKQSQRDIRDDMLTARSDAAALQSSLAQRETNKGAEILKFENQLKAQVGYRDMPKDALTRMIAWLELKDDSKNGPAIWWFSMAVGIFVSLIEMMPVLIKLLFFPPNVYSADVHDQVLFGQRRVHEATKDSQLEEMADRIKMTGERFRHRMQREMDRRNSANSGERDAL